MCIYVHVRVLINKLTLRRYVHIFPQIPRHIYGCLVLVIIYICNAYYDCSVCMRVCMCECVCMLLTDITNKSCLVVCCHKTPFHYSVVLSFRIIIANLYYYYIVCACAYVCGCMLCNTIPRIMYCICFSYPTHYVMRCFTIIINT